MDTRADTVKARFRCPESCLCNLQLKNDKNLSLISQREITAEANSDVFDINAFFLQKNISLQLHKHLNVEMPKTVHLENNITMVSGDS